MLHARTAHAGVRLPGLTIFKGGKIFWNIFIFKILVQYYKKHFKKYFNFFPKEIIFKKKKIIAPRTQVYDCLGSRLRQAAERDDAAQVRELVAGGADSNYIS